MTTRIAVSPLSGRIHQGRVNKEGNAFVGEKKDVTSDVLLAVVEKAQFHGGSFEIEGGGKTFVVTVTEPAAVSPDRAALLELIAFLNGEAALDGVWFGDPRPGEKGRYWWRKRLGGLLASMPSPAEHTDAWIESAFRYCGGRWDGSRWIIEDADLHPFVRTMIARSASATTADPREAVQVAVRYVLEGMETPRIDEALRRIDGVLDMALTSVAAVVPVQAPQSVARVVTVAQGANRGKQVLMLRDLPNETPLYLAAPPHPAEARDEQGPDA